MQKRLESMRRVHEEEHKNTLIMAQHFAVDYFKQKSVDLRGVFYQEIKSIRDSFTNVALDMFLNENRLTQLFEFALRQEYLQAEVRTFMFESMSKIFQKVDHYTEMTLEQLKTNKSLSEETKQLEIERAMNNPFQLYASYLDVVRPITLEENVKHDKAKIKELEDNIEVLTEQANSTRHFAEMYLDIEKDFNKRIFKLKTENQELRD